MRILWFVNLPPNEAAEHIAGLRFHYGGWIDSLKNVIETSAKDLDLGIAFPWWKKKYGTFKIGRTEYYVLPVLTTQNPFFRVFSYWFHEIESLNIINYYLKTVNDFKPDIVHIFGTESAYGLMIPKIEQPCVIHIQGNLMACHNKYFSGITMLKLLRYCNRVNLAIGQGLFHNYIRLKKLIVREREIFNICSYFMGRTSWDKRLVKIFSPKASYYECHEVMRPIFYRYAWSPLRNNKEIVFSSMRGNIYKGLETLYEVAKLLCKYGREIEFRIAGITKSDEIVRICKKAAGTTEYDRNIVYLGMIEGKMLVKEMMQADVFLHPSHIDNSSNSVCEAMMLGMPIVSTNAGGTASLIKDNEEGLLVQDGDPYGMAGAILEILENKNLANRISMNARKTAHNRHDPLKIVDNLKNIYSDIVETHMRSCSGIPLSCIKNMPKECLEQ